MQGISPAKTQPHGVPHSNHGVFRRLSALLEATHLEQLFLKEPNSLSDFMYAVRCCECQEQSRVVSLGTGLEWVHFHELAL